MHQAMGGAQGQAADIEIAAREIMRMQDLIRGIIANHSGKPMEDVIHDTDRDFYLDPEGALDYGIIDEVLTKPTKEEAKK
jgi:ATP-dependent Clp protease protease subunit